MLRTLYTRCPHKRKQVYYGRDRSRIQYMKQTIKISNSVAICTKNRHDLLTRIYKQLQQSLPHPSSTIVIVDQTELPISLKQTRIKLRYIHAPNQHGLSLARNTAMAVSKSKLVTFIDDDCIVDANYTNTLSTTNEASLQKKNIAIVFGKTKAYQKNQHITQYCPCTFEKNSSKPIESIQDHSVAVGYGNNMIIRKDVVKNIGGFKWWLGAGSIGESAEDAEFIVRCLLAGYLIGYDNNLLVYHNRWLEKKALYVQMSQYRCGGLAAYGFYYFQGVTECKNIIKAHIRESWDSILTHTRAATRNPQTFLSGLHAITSEIYYVCKGIMLAFVFAKIIPIPTREDVVKRFYHHSKFT